jgi:hypothetical protein
MASINNLPSYNIMYLFWSLLLYSFDNNVYTVLWKIIVNFKKKFCDICFIFIIIFVIIVIIIFTILLNILLKSLKNSLLFNKAVIDF